MAILRANISTVALILYANPISPYQESWFGATEPPSDHDQEGYILGAEDRRRLREGEAKREALRRFVWNCR